MRVQHIRTSVLEVAGELLVQARWSHWERSRFTLEGISLQARKQEAHDHIGQGPLAGMQALFKHHLLFRDDFTGVANGRF